MKYSAAFVFLLLLNGPYMGRGEDIVGWRGDGTGVFATANPETIWSKSKNLKWQTELPGGSPASPIVVDNRVFVLSDPYLLFCVDAESGNILWKSEHAKELSEGAIPNHSFNPDGHAGSCAGTPVSDGKFVYAAFANGAVSSHDLEGKRQWARVIELPKTVFGHSSSPLLAGDKLLVHFGDLVALSSKDGKEVWRVKIPPSHGTAAIARVDEENLLVHPSGSVIRVSDGKILSEGQFNDSKSSPAVLGNKFYIHEKGMLKSFTLSELSGEKINVRLNWESETRRGQYQIASPLIHDGLVYSISLDCNWQVNEADTGNLVYRQKLPLAARAYASVQLAGENLFASDQTGKTVVIAPGRSFRQIAVNELEYHPTNSLFSGTRIFVRTHRHVCCIAK